MIAITDYMYQEIDKGKVCLVVTIDLRKAFDKVDRTVLLHKLSWYGIDTKLIESLLKDRSQYVSLKCGCDVNCSSTKETELGVPQGSCISCVLFSLLMNDLCCRVRNSLPVLYADDKTLIAPSVPEELDLTINKLEEDIDNVVGCLTNSRLLVNDDKTELS
jgi:hypothetical protein